VAGVRCHQVLDWYRCSVVASLVSVESHTSRCTLAPAHSALYQAQTLAVCFIAFVMLA
jgi:hypothetical protein